MVELIVQAENLVTSGLPEEAKKVATRASKRRIVSVNHCRRLAVVFTKAHNPEKALEMLKVGLQLDVSNTGVQDDLVRLLIDLGRYEEAVEICCELMLTLDKVVDAVDLLKIEMLQRSNISGAIFMCDAALQLEQFDPKYYFYKAVLLQHSGDFSQAMRCFLEAQEVDIAGEMAEDIKDAIGMLDRYQLKQILSIANADLVFRTKLMLDPDSACAEKGYLISRTALHILSHIDYSEFPENPRPMNYS